MEEHHVPGISVAVVRGNAPAVARGFGCSSTDTKDACTPDTLFDVASCAKSLTASAVALLVEDNESYPSVQYNTTMASLLPEDFVMASAEYTLGVTVEDILSHRTGMAGAIFAQEKKTEKETLGVSTNADWGQCADVICRKRTTGHGDNVETAAIGSPNNAQHKISYNQRRGSTSSKSITQFPPLPTPWESYTGVWNHPGYRTLTVTVKDERLFIDASNRSIAFTLTFQPLGGQFKYIAHLSDALEGGSEPVDAEFIFQEGRAVRLGLDLEPAARDLICSERPPVPPDPPDLADPPCPAGLAGPAGSGTTTGPATTGTGSATLSTSTVFTTQIITVTKCAPTVTNCPASSTVTTHTVVPVTTVICPVNGTATGVPPTGPATNTPVGPGGATTLTTVVPGNKPTGTVPGGNPGSPGTPSGKPNPGNPGTPGGNPNPGNPGKPGNPGSNPSGVVPTGPAVKPTSPVVAGAGRLELSVAAFLGMALLL
ncbi:hypothetical protein NLG97_g156 [Lecanicillium saksenae]|uniref:Uncharacterized protein n=1 Tax=Lecanicillium saksenae TaxID=468837 RepID=A0ACC1R9C7_9HYPO|nr:hypothetical protein NLG97_g156 [Lecanicillium saksenae]